MRPRRPVALLAAATLALAGCADDEAGDVEASQQDGAEDADPGQPADDSPDVPDARDEGTDAAPEDLSGVEPPEVELVDPGQEPLEPLRLELSAGSSATSELTVVTGVRDLEIDGQPQPDQPPLAFVLAITGEVTEVDDDGTATVALDYDEVRLADDADIAEEQRAPLEQQLSALAEVSGAFTFDDRSRIVDSRLEVPDAMDPQLGSTLRELEQEVAALAFPFPEEPVGPGAVWELTTEQDLSGIPSTQVTTVTLDAREGDDYGLTIRIDAGSPAGDIELPGMPPDASARLVELDVSSTGSVTGSLTEAFPLSAEASGGGPLALEFEDDGETSTLSQQLITEFHLRRSQDR